MDTAFTPTHRGGSGPPMVLIHGIMDTWRTWELVLAGLERHHDVLAVTLAGHAGGPPLDGADPAEALLRGVEDAMDEAGFRTAHLVGNSLGGYVALNLAARGRARTVVAFAPGGGWAPDDRASRATLRFQAGMYAQAKGIAPQAEAIVSTPDGRRRATRSTTVNYEHIPAGLLAHQLRGIAAGDGVPKLLDNAMRNGWNVDAEHIECPVRIVWGTADEVLRWPAAAARYREDWLPHADWVELDGVGHCPQLDVPLETAQLILGFARER
jgi:pimeloyl-ACP methyl ester carboxylesterase